MVVLGDSVRLNARLPALRSLLIMADDRLRLGGSWLELPALTHLRLRQSAGDWGEPNLSGGAEVDFSGMPRLVELEFAAEAWLAPPSGMTCLQHLKRLRCFDLIGSRLFLPGGGLRKSRCSVAAALVRGAPPSLCSLEMEWEPEEDRSERYSPEDEVAHCSLLGCSVRWQLTKLSANTAAVLWRPRGEAGRQVNPRVARPPA